MQPAASVLDRIKGWRPYVEAKLGFRNHWYPTLFSSEIEEGKPKAFKLLGENLLLNRVDGKVYCIRNRCLHRGVNFSSRLECYAKGTITCWYHGWTYAGTTARWSASSPIPTSSQIGQAPHPHLPGPGGQGPRLRLRRRRRAAAARPRRSAGLPRRRHGDLRPEPRRVKSNWRLGVENGFDAGHIWIHKKSILVTGNDMALPRRLRAARGRRDHAPRRGRGRSEGRLRPARRMLDAGLRELSRTARRSPRAFRRQPRAPTTSRSGCPACSRSIPGRSRA